MSTIEHLSPAHATSAAREAAASSLGSGGGSTLPDSQLLTRLANAFFTALPGASIDPAIATPPVAAPSLPRALPATVPASLDGAHLDALLSELVAPRPGRTVASPRPTAIPRDPIPGSSAFEQSGSSLYFLDHVQPPSPRGATSPGRQPLDAATHVPRPHASMRRRCGETSRRCCSW